MNGVARLLLWFRRTARDLPWRRTKDPYAVWVSEVMLQQTRVATVIPYYRRWMRRWPTVRSLSRARLDDVLKMWEGLGYYARARNLHAAARAWTSPQTAGEWRALPGVGEYTSSAIASIAHGERAAVLDGNVRRVMSRVLRTDDAARIRAALDAAVPARAPGDFNQAMMELGQRVCTPRSPKCRQCPLARGCAARAAGAPEDYPRRAPTRKVPHYDIAIGVCRKGGRVLVAQRKPDGLLGGLWEFPGGKREGREPYEKALAREFREETGIEIGGIAPFMTVDHRYSHFAVTLHVFTCVWRRGRARALGSARVRWAAPGELRSLAWPAANKRVVERLPGESRIQNPGGRGRRRPTSYPP